MPKNAAPRKLRIDRATERIVEGIQTIREGSIFARDAFGAYPSALCQLSLPTRAQIGKSEFTARYATNGGHFGFSIFTPVEYGIPFGCYPRAIFSYVYRTLMKQKREEVSDPRIIHMGNNLRSCMNRITGIDHGKITGGPRGSQTLFEKQLDSFVRSHMRFFYPRNSAGVRAKQEQAFALFSRLDQRQASLFPLGDTEPRWDTHVRVSEDLFLDAIEHAVPVDDDILKALWQSPLRIDQYTWLTYRANELEGKPLQMSWRSLMQQFGAGYSPTSHRGFRAEFRAGIKAVQQVYDVDDRDCVRFEEDGDKVTFTIKRPSVSYADGAARDPRRHVFLPPRVPSAAEVPSWSAAIAAQDPAEQTLFSLLLTPATLNPSAPASPQPPPAPQPGVILCRRCAERYPLPSGEAFASQTICPACNFTQLFTGWAVA